MTAATPQARMDVALGLAPPSLVVSGGRVVNVFTREVELADVAISGERIAGIRPAGGFDGLEVPVVQADGRFVSPGLVDAHFHVGGSHMDVAHLAEALLARGTTAIATDLYEIYVAGGPSAVRQALDDARRSGLKILFVAPAHLIGLEDVGTFAWPVSLADMQEMLAWPETVGINEPPATAVLARPPGLVELLEQTIDMNKIVVGHAPSETGQGLQAYVGLGASSDHESRDEREALVKLRVGMRPMMRHGSASPDLIALLGLARSHPASTRYMMLCSDETDPGDLARDGHMDAKIRLAIGAGLDPLTAIEMGSINVAEYYGVAARIGSIAPGRWADLVLVPELESFRPDVVIASGRVIDVTSRPGTTGLDRSDADRTKVPPTIASRVVLPGPVEAATFRSLAPGTDTEAVDVRVIGVRDGTLVSEALERRLAVRDGVVLADPVRDILRISVIERHHASGRVGRGFVEGFGLRDGAVALTYCHVFHNLLVVGTSDEAMSLAAATIAKDGGGIAVVAGDRVTGRWRLPMVGVLDDRPLRDVAPAFEQINAAIRAIGCPMSSPVLALSFVALPTIPSYGLTDRGLYDVGGQRFVDVIVGDGGVR
jgi:adenine deaminase